MPHHKYIRRHAEAISNLSTHVRARIDHQRPRNFGLESTLAVFGPVWLLAVAQRHLDRQLRCAALLSAEPALIRPMTRTRPRVRIAALRAGALARICRAEAGRIITRMIPPGRRARRRLRRPAPHETVPSPPADRNDESGGGVDVTVTTWGFIGSGNIGTAVARLAVAAGHDVALSNSRGPEPLSTSWTIWVRTPERQPRPRRPGRVTSSSRSLRGYPQVPTEQLHGKIVIDTMIYYPRGDGNIAELDDEATTSSALFQAHCPTPGWSRASTTSSSTSLLSPASPTEAPSLSRATTTRRRRPSASPSTRSATTWSTLAPSRRGGARARHGGIRRHVCREPEGMGPGRPARLGGRGRGAGGGGVSRSTTHPSARCTPATTARHR